MSTVEQLLGRRGLLDGFRRAGGRLFGCCPIHGGDNPRAFVVDLLGDRWYCFTRCQRGGGPVALARALDLPVGEVTARVSQPPPRPFVPYERRLSLDPRVPWLVNKGSGPRIASLREVGGWTGRGMLAGCVAVRLHDAAGRPHGYAGRRLDPAAAAERGKWVFPPRLPKAELLYGLHHVRGTSVVLTECPWGVLRLAQLGVEAVALLGVALSGAQADFLRRFDRVVILLDGDDAGRTAAEQISGQLGGRVVLAHLPDGADPDDLGDRDLADLISLSS